MLACFGISQSCMCQERQISRKEVRTEGHGGARADAALQGPGGPGGSPTPRVRLNRSHLRDTQGLGVGTQKDRDEIFVRKNETICESVFCMCEVTGGVWDSLCPELSSVAAAAQP